MITENSFQITDAITEKFKELNDTWANVFPNSPGLELVLVLKETADFVAAIRNSVKEMMIIEHRIALTRYTPEAMGTILTDLKEAVQYNYKLYEEKLDVFKSINFEKAQKTWELLNTTVDVPPFIIDTIRSENYNRSLSLSENLANLGDFPVSPKEEKSITILEASLLHEVYKVDQEILKYLERYPQKEHIVQKTTPAERKIGKKDLKKPPPTLKEIWQKHLCLPENQRLLNFKEAMNALKAYNEVVYSAFVVEPALDDYYWLRFKNYKSFAAGFIVDSIGKENFLNVYSGNQWVEVVKKSLHISVPVDYFRPDRIINFDEKFLKPFRDLIKKHKPSKSWKPSLVNLANHVFSITIGAILLSQLSYGNLRKLISKL